MNKLKSLAKSRGVTQQMIMDHNRQLEDGGVKTNYFKLRLENCWSKKIEGDCNTFNYQLRTCQIIPDYSNVVTFLDDKIDSNSSTDGSDVIMDDDVVIDVIFDKDLLD